MGFVGLRLRIYLPSQVLQVYRRFCHRHCLSFCRKIAITAGLLCSTGVTPLQSSYEPLRLPLASVRFPGGCRLYGRAAPQISPWGEEGLSSCSARPCHRAVAATPPECPAASANLRRAMLPSPPIQGLGLRIDFFRGYFCVHSRYGPVTRSPSRRWLCRWASGHWFPFLPAIQATRPLTLASVGFTSH